MANLKTGLCWFFALFFVMAGALHFIHDTAFAAIVPPFLPFKYQIVWMTGVMEIVFAVGLLIQTYRWLSAKCLAVFLLAVLPANIYMAIAGIGFGDSVASPTVLWLRVALQFPLIALILWAAQPRKTAAKSRI